MKVSDIFSKIDVSFPFDNACDWDNVGLLVGSMDKEIHRVYVALDATDQVIDHAIACQCDLLITHHPLIFSGLNSVVDSDIIGRRVIKLVANNISYIAMHTNFDIYAMGNICAERIGLVDYQPIELCFEKVVDGASLQYGIGQIGELPNQMTLEEVGELIKGRFNLPTVRVYGDLKENISRLAILPGSGKSDIDIALKKGGQVMVTGDIDHHSGIDAVAKGINIIDAGHFGLEHVFIDFMSEYLKKIDGLEIFAEDIKNPFTVI